MKTLTAEQKIRYASCIMRLGLAFVFLYAAISALLHPDVWVWFVPSVAANFVDPKTALQVLSVSQIVLAGWLLWGKFARYAALLAVAFLGGVVVSNVGSLVITFRDIGLMLGAVVVALLDL